MLPRISGRECVRALEKAGFVVRRQRGSHIVVQTRLSATTVTMPVPDHAELELGTLASIIRQTGVPRTLFET